MKNIFLILQLSNHMLSGTETVTQTTSRQDNLFNYTSDFPIDK